VGAVEWALRYGKLGWPVIPLRGKLPITQHGSKDATADESQVRAWWARWPDANVGLATGHRFFVVDVDVKTGGEETWDMLRAQHGSLPATIEQLTGTGGKHILYTLPDFPVKNSASKIGPGIDVRGEGGYIVAAPSLHPVTNRAYSWDGLQEIEQQQIAAAPPWLLKMLREDVERRQSGSKMPEQITEGRRNDTLFRGAARLRRAGFTAEELLASLKVINESRCNPPLPMHEVKTIALSAARYKPVAVAGSEVFEERPSEGGLSQTDIEARIDEAIAKNDLLAAMKLAEHVAKLRVHAQVLIKTRLRAHFKKEFRVSDFEKSIRDFDPKRSLQAALETDVAEEDLLRYPLTDSGNAERIVALYGQKLRYCVEMERWLVWDGRRWEIDKWGNARELAKTMARALYRQAGAAEEVQKFARKSESQAAIIAMLKRAADHEKLRLEAAALDQHPYLLNCLNGMIDLRNGKLLPHDPECLITKLCHVPYEPEAECPRFLKFLHWAMGDNPESDLTPRVVNLVSFLQRVFGYSLTADVSEKAAFVFWGPNGNNGKTTLLTIFRTLLDEYSAQISIDALMMQRGAMDAAMRADLADLRGARFVMTSEVEKEHRLSEGKLKYITAGMGDIKSCRKYENPIEFPATHKLFMDCNHRPTVRGTDNAIWRRLKPVPFEVSIEETDPEFDKNLAARLEAEDKGILAWTVRGCLEWQQKGLGDVAEIKKANTEWRENDDPLREFIEDCCDVGNGQWVRSAELAAAYAWWAKQHGERFPLGREPFQERIKALGFRYSRSREVDGKQIRSWEGIGLKPETVSDTS